MSLDEIRNAIEAKLKEREKMVLNKNAVNAFLGAFTDPIGSLGKIFIGRGNALDEERQMIAQDALIELVCKIDQAISDTHSECSARGVIEVAGLIEVIAENATNVIGVDISNPNQPVRFSPGTHIRTVASNADSLTGLRIGGDPKKKQES